jgi:hypothetical protein
MRALERVQNVVADRPVDVYAAAAECHAACGHRFIAGSGCEVSPLTPPENLRAPATHARDQAGTSIDREADGPAQSPSSSQSANTTTT